MPRLICCLLMSLLLAAGTLESAELVRLNKDNWSEFVPKGKEADRIYGDFVLRNDKLVAVIADPLRTRNANMTVRDVGGKIIDLTSRNRSNDQLSLYAPMGVAVSFHSPSTVKIEANDTAIPLDELVKASGESVTWECSATALGGLRVTVRYEVADGKPFLKVRTTLENQGENAKKVSLIDALRADRTFKFGSDEESGLFWFQDDWFNQAYGVLAEGYRLKQSGSRGSTLRLLPQEGETVEVAGKSQLVINRKLIPARNLLELRGRAHVVAGLQKEERYYAVKVQVVDSAGPIKQALVTVKRDGKDVGSGRTSPQGRLSFMQAAGKLSLTVNAIGRAATTFEVDVTDGHNDFKTELPEAGYVAGEVTDDAGKPIPCKVAFHGVDGTPTPDFGPDSGHTSIKNVHYSHAGKFRQIIGPGKYELIVSYGPEYDAVFRTIEVKAGEETKVSAKLKRVVDTTGWISSDFHSHSSPSGDNTGSQFGRVQNLLCEHIEFAPCTEHNRISTYVPHLKRLGAEALMGTCSGMELTGSPLPVNHQNSFPLRLTRRTQDGGGPTTDTNPVVQIERLALWDDGSDKLVQENHPNLLQILSDRDLDGKPDGGFQEMFGFMDVIEVHPPAGIFTKPEKDKKGKLSRNPIYHWLQLLNLGYRIPGVVNTDAHYNYHESGWLRNYVKSPTDEPAKIDVMDVVHASEAGNVIMTTGPFLTVSMHAGGETKAMPGEDLTAGGGKATLDVRVQCPNWLDVNRVQVFVNGRAKQSLNFTRREKPDAFLNEVVKFQRSIPIEVDEDAHVIVAAIGEGLELGRIMGPRFGKLPPVAVSNPIFVDVDGNGFQANGDILDVPIPGK